MGASNHVLIMHHHNIMHSAIGGQVHDTPPILCRDPYVVPLLQDADLLRSYHTLMGPATCRT